MADTIEMTVHYADGLAFECDTYPAKDGFDAFEVLHVVSGSTTLRLFFRNEDARSVFAAAASKFLFPVRED